MQTATELNGRQLETVRAVEFLTSQINKGYSANEAFIQTKTQYGMLIAYLALDAIKRSMTND